MSVIEIYRPNLLTTDITDGVENLRMTASQFTEATLQILNPKKNSYEPFDFRERPYLQKIYNTPSRRVIQVFSRQSEKTCVLDSPILMEDGSIKLAKDVVVGDRVVTYREDTNSTTTSSITWKSRNYRKPCFLVRTGQNHSIVVGEDHPIRTFYGWRPARSLEKGDRVAIVREAGIFTGTFHPEEDRVVLTAYMLGDGSMSNNFTFTCGSKDRFDDFMGRVKGRGGCRGGLRGRNYLIGVHRDNDLYRWLKEDGLLDKRSWEKFIPGWVFSLDRAMTALFLGRLWSTDGSSRIVRGRVTLDYCSTSSRMIHQVQALLWKFGIHSRIRENLPTYTVRGEKRRGRLAYILSIRTNEGTRRFLSEISLVGKENYEMSLSDKNNCRDTLPRELGELVFSIVDSGKRGKIGALNTREMQRAGMSKTPEYPLSREKAGRLLSIFRGNDRYDQRLVDRFELNLKDDIFWDTVKEVTSIGDEECVDFTVEGTHSYVIDGVITHNSTALCNIGISYCLLRVGCHVLYVSPSSSQTKEFSETRLKDTIEVSPVIQQFTNKNLLDSVFKKQWINRSQFILKYAFLTADRVRGITADVIFLDEFQDILTDLVPVILECASRRPDSNIYRFAGTPKTHDNVLQYYWEVQSNQSEWVIPCDFSGGDTRHWNVLGMKNIGKKGPICSVCGNPLRPDSPEAHWVSMNTPKVPGIPYEGYRVCRLSVPWIWKDKDIWENEILNKLSTYKTAQFYNEVLALPYDSGVRPVTREEIINCCDPTGKLDLGKDSLIKVRQALIRSSTGLHPCWMGIDWSGGTEKSYTVLHLLTYLDGVLTVFYSHRFEGGETEPKEQLELIETLIDTYQPSKIGADFGGGYWPNRILQRKYGKDRVHLYQYAGSKKKIDWSAELGRFTVNKHLVMSDFFTAIKDRKLRFPAWAAWEDPFAKDIMAIFAEYDERTHQDKYNKRPDDTDDSFHALIYGALASMLDKRRPDILTPDNVRTSQIAMVSLREDSDR